MSTVVRIGRYTRQDALCEAAIAAVKELGDYLTHCDLDAAARAYQVMCEVQALRRPEVIRELEAQRLAMVKGR